MHSTNYADAFIEVSEDARAAAGVEPSDRGGRKSVARLEYAHLREKTGINHVRGMRGAR